MTAEPRLALAGDVPLRIHAARGASRGGGAVLFFHGLRSSSDVLDADARVIADAGVTVILVDAPHHGARRDAVLEKMPDTGTRAGYATLLRILREARDEVPALVDHARALGFGKVAIGGVSLGGYIALSAAVSEPHLAAVASLLGSPDWTPHEGEAAASRDAYADALAESPHLRAEALAPRPLLQLVASRDRNVPPGPSRALAARLAPLYDAHGARDALLHREVDSEHFVPEPLWRGMIAETASFLARALAGLT